VEILLHLRDFQARGKSPVLGLFLGAASSSDLFTHKYCYRAMFLNVPILVTGGAGFIGSAFVLQWLTEQRTTVTVLDKLTYAGNLENLTSVAQDPRYRFVRGDIVDSALVRRLLDEQHPGAIVHFAAESHVDRSILGPAEFIRTNIEGRFRCWKRSGDTGRSCLPSNSVRSAFCTFPPMKSTAPSRPTAPAFTEETPYAPNSPYSASKASSDHLVRAYHHTYGLPVLTTNCSNNYGPRQFPEKLIPLVILNALKGVPLPVYGDGQNVRDWLYVEDHCDGIRTVLDRGIPGQTYNIGGRQEMSNLEVVRQICAILDELKPTQRPYESLVTFVKDRPGHDRRYAMDIAKIERELGWRPRETFASGLRKTIEWYLDNLEWVEHVTSGSYREWINLQYNPSSPAGAANQ
jgi:dTDP-glucose 4,6-dehydratase